MSFVYERLIRFQDTDAAGIVYFANALNLCHEAYEMSLAASGIPLRTFFSSVGYAVPIVEAAVKFYQPMYCGDRIAVELHGKITGEDTFRLAYELFVLPRGDRAVATAQTSHCCIDAATRKRHDLPEELLKWLNQFP